MKKLLVILCCILAATATFSCSDDKLKPDTEVDDTPVTPRPDKPEEEEEKPDEPAQPEDPVVQEIKPMLDIVFEADGTAKDNSANNYTVERFDGLSMLTWKNPAYDGYIVRFSHTIGADLPDSYYKFNYMNETEFRNKMSDGYSMEAILMLDETPDGEDELKAFCSTERGGTGFMISKADRGTELTFLTNVSDNGSSKWVWGQTGITPERGKYYHIIGVWDKDNNEARVYVDGELKNTVKTSGSFNFPNTGACHWFCIGGDPAPESVRSAWRGDVTMARVYDEALTTEWVQKHWNDINVRIPKSTYLPEDVIYMANCNVKAGGTFGILGKGFESSDVMEIESKDGSYKKSCTCAATESKLTATLPSDITSGTYKIMLRRGSEIYPVGATNLTVTNEANALKAPKIIAHRGFHPGDVPENSFEAFVKAQEMKFYGSEIDVWITTDDVVVCNHNETLSGKNIHKSTYDQIKDLTLDNGEKIPTLEAVLDQLAKSNDTKLILEIKTHSTSARNNAAVDTSIKMIKEKGLEHMVDYIAFDYDVCKRIAAAMPEASVGYLDGNKSPATVNADGINNISYKNTVLTSNPNWIKEAHDLGMKVNVWTVNSDYDMMNWIAKGADYITTDNPDRLQVIIDAFCE